MKRIDLEVRSANAQREESRAAQGLLHQALLDQFGFVLQTNQHLQAKLQRLENKQEILKESVKQAISVGLNDIQQRLGSIKVSDIIAEIPSKFREDLRTEITATADRLINQLITEMKELPDNFFTNDKNAGQLLSQTVERLLFRVINENKYYSKNAQYIKIRVSTGPR